MSDHVTHLLNKYFDRQLSPDDIRKVEDHLAVCSQCQRELDKFRSLSILLNEVSTPAPSMSADQLISKLENRMSSRYTSTSKRVFHLLWMFFPGGLAACWGFVQALFMTIFVFNWGILLGLFPGMNAFLSGNSQSLLANLLNSILVSEWGEVGSSIFQVLSNPVLQSAVIYIVLQSLIGVLFLSWLASWYSSNKRITRQII